MRGAEGVDLVVDGGCGRCGGGGFEEVEPRVGERDDGGGYAVRVHEGEFVGDGRVFGPDGAAPRGAGRGGRVFAGEDDEARRVRGVGEVADVGDGGAGAEEGDVGGGVDVRVDVDGWHGGGGGGGVGVLGDALLFFLALYSVG